MKRITGAMAVLGVLALAGCATVDVAASPTPTVSETVTPTPSPTPTPVVDLSDPGNWVIGFGSLGPLKVGSTIADSGPILDSFTIERQDACPWLTIITAPDTFAGVRVWVPTGTNDVINQLLVDDTRTGVATHSPRTAAGIGVGSTVGEVVAAYPDVVVADGYYGSTIYSVTDGSGYYINMSIDNDAVRSLGTRNSAGVDSELCG